MLMISEAFLSLNVQARSFPTGLVINLINRAAVYIASELVAMQGPNAISANLVAERRTRIYFAWIWFRIVESVIFESAARRKALLRMTERV